MLNSSIQRACALLMTASVLSCAAVSQAGLFDRFKAKPRRTPAATVSNTTMRRGQSPMTEPAPSVWQPPAGAVATTPWYSDPYQQGFAPSESVECCGPEDKWGRHTKTCREKCDQTFYPPVPPYCFPCYGFNPTCWRRMQECSICPREALPPPAAPRKAPRQTTPKVEPTPVPPSPSEPPEPMDDPSARRQRSRPSGVASARSQPPAASAPLRSRWTSYADALPQEKEVEVPEASADTLEEMIEAEDETSVEAPTDEVDAIEEETLTEDATEAVAEEADAGTP